MTLALFINVLIIIIITLSLYRQTTLKKTFLGTKLNQEKILEKSTKSTHKNNPLGPYTEER